MIVLRSVGFTVALAACTALVSAQQLATGTVDYVLGNSSVMWIPRSSSIFLNPGELARLHQDEFLVTAGRFKSLASMSGAVFVPGTGTFGLGVTPLVNSTQFSAGFGRLFGDYNTLGGAVSVIPKVERSVRLSFGGSIHLPTAGQETGAHAALSVTNVLSKVAVNVGGAFWLIPSTVRLQVATRTRTERAEFLGVEVRALEGVHVQVGTRGFKKILAGASYTTSYANLEFGAGPEGISFTMNVRVGDAASDMHDDAYNLGDEAYIDQQYGDAREHFLKAVQYNEYDSTSRFMAERSRHMLDSSVTALLQQASEDEGQSNFTEAMRAYAQILRIDPQQTMAVSNLANVEKKLKLYVQQLLVSGDSLKNLHEVTRARKSYELALELDPENDSASVRIDALENLSKENALSLLSKARSLLRKNQLDEAQKEFERILSTDPNNSQARSGMRTIGTRRINEQLTRGKTAFDAQRFIEALQIFSEVVQKDRNNREANQFLERTREVLRSDVDRMFKTGLQFYIKEDFKSAIAAWDKVLMIQPEDSSTLEYRKRAEEKLKALEQFK